MKKQLDRITVVLFAVLLFGLGIAFWILPDKPRSEEENRPLQTFPTLTPEGWLDGTVSARLTDYYSDQFPLRSTWVSFRALGELALGRGESGGVLLGPDGQLAVRRFDTYLSRTERLTDTDVYSPPHVEASLEAIVTLNDTLTADGIPLCVLLAPRTIDVVAATLPYPATLSDRLDATIQEAFADTDVCSVELLSTFRDLHENGDYVYYRTDHHWTTYGAYTAYAAILRAWGMEEEILPPSAFTVRTVPDFRGTTHARAGMFFVPPDTLELWEAADGSDRSFTVRDGEGNTVIASGFYSEAYLSQKDKYSVFLDGTHRLLTITDEAAAARGETRPRLLVARDSFANSMIPFLARHFDIVMVNLSGGMTDVSSLTKAHQCTRVLLVCNRENLITSDCLLQVK